MADDVNKIECRQLSEDTFQLRSYFTLFTVNREGFNIWRESRDLFEQWCATHKVEPVSLPLDTQDG
jgi:hypothetical protein